MKKLQRLTKDQKKLLRDNNIDDGNYLAERNITDGVTFVDRHITHKLCYDRETKTFRKEEVKTWKS